MKQLKILIILTLLSTSLIGQTDGFKHDWEMQYLENDIQFVSKKITPPPFSKNEEPQAIMIVGASMIDNSIKKNLEQIVESEIEFIRKDYKIIEYLEEDYEPKDNIVSYFEKIGSIQTATIKYRINGEKNGPAIMPRSIRQILFIYNDKLYISTLLVLYAEDQDNMKSDQMYFINKILGN